jgi:hypothetical protein
MGCKKRIRLFQELAIEKLGQLIFGDSLSFRVRTDSAKTIAHVDQIEA